MQFKHVTLEFDGSVAVLKLDHQEVMNAVSIDMLGGLGEALDAIDDRRADVPGCDGPYAQSLFRSARIGTEALSLILTRFLYANRYPLRSKTLSTPYLIFKAGLSMVGIRTSARHRTRGPAAKPHGNAHEHL